MYVNYVACPFYCGQAIFMWFNGKICINIQNPLKNVQNPKINIQKHWKCPNTKINVQNLWKNVQNI
ncbi:hypothetical protein BTR25_03035 [Bacillus sp. MRMR6]|nr:hypothetical protein BTR25_03035 [Bacillus sp. MRMR6]